MSEGLKQLQIGQCTFKSVSGKKLFVGIHVDDGIIIGNDQLQTKQLLTKMEKHFEVHNEF